MAQSTGWGNFLPNLFAQTYGPARSTFQQDVSRVFTPGTRAQGLYGVAGRLLGMPEMGVSEVGATGGNVLPSATMNVLGQQPGGAGPQPIPQQTGGGGGGYPAPTPMPTVSPEGQEPGTSDIYATLEQEYSNAITPFEQAIRGEAVSGTQAVEAQGQQQKTALKGETKSAMGKARQLYNELVGQQQAKLSAIGASSSSASEAYGEQAMRRMQEQSATIQNAAMQESASIDEFVRSKSAQLISDAQNRIAQLRADMMADIAKIKREDRLEAVKAYRNMSIEIETYTKKGHIELEQYRQKKQVELSNRYQQAVSPYSSMQQYGNLMSGGWTPQASQQASGLPTELMGQYTGNLTDEEKAKQKLLGP